MITVTLRVGHSASAVERVHRFVDELRYATYNIEQGLFYDLPWGMVDMAEEFTEKGKVRIGDKVRADVFVYWLYMMPTAKRCKGRKTELLRVGHE